MYRIFQANVTDRAAGNGRLPVIFAACLVFLIALQGIFVGHELTHDGPTLERCAICHVTGHAAAPASASTDLFDFEFTIEPRWFPRDSVPAPAPLTYRRASRAPPAHRI